MNREVLLERVKQAIYEVEPNANIILYGMIRSCFLKTAKFLQHRRGLDALAPNPAEYEPKHPVAGQTAPGQA